MRNEPNRPAIEMRGITKRFAGVIANDGVDFEARFGEVHALIGENGAGKSTLMSILAGLYRPDSGTMVIDGAPVQFRSPRDGIEHGIGMVYQHFMLVEPFTVAENVLLGQTGGGFKLETAAAERRLTDIAKQYGLDVDPKARIWQLSVGEQQRVEILRLLFRGARILVFDEPTAVLTPHEAASLIKTLRSLAAGGYCVVFISHKLDEVRAVADRVTVMARGKIVDVVPASTERGVLARSMVGRDLAAAVERPDASLRSGAAAGPVVLVLAQVCAGGDKGIPALVDVDLDVCAGEILGIAGVAGNGQRELAEVVTGLRRVTSGRISVSCVEVANAAPGKIASLGVAHIPEDRIATGLIAGMPVSGNAILRDYRRPPLAKGPFLASRAVSTFADRLITLYDVKTPGRQTKVGSLSGGNQQKLLIGRELSGAPAVVVAVHPTRGVDIGASETIHRLLTDQRGRGAAILLISEDLDELMALSDRIAVLYNGQVVGTVSSAEADRDRIGVMMTGVDPALAEAERHG